MSTNRDRDGHKIRRTGPSRGPPVGALTADAVALEARKAAEGETFTELSKAAPARPVQPQEETGGTVTFQGR
ncbi:hypothetical protein [Streptomyces mirabilis]|uniref:hypothetical protein n=1 Tax=Streptomyces mirabilis TaxID=68239 RepID=UPI003426472D